MKIIAAVATAAMLLVVGPAVAAAPQHLSMREAARAAKYESELMVAPFSEESPIVRAVCARIDTVTAKCAINAVGQRAHLQFVLRVRETVHTYRFIAWGLHTLPGRLVGAHVIR